MMTNIQKLIACALLGTVASPLLAQHPVSAKQHTAAPHDHTPRVHERFTAARFSR